MIDLIHQAYDSGKFFDVRRKEIVDDLSSRRVQITSEVIDELVVYYLDGRLYPAKYAPILGIKPMTLMYRFKTRHNVPNAREVYRDEVKRTREQTNLKKFGIDNPLKSPEVREQIKQTNIERYGADNVFKTEYFREKRRETCLELYGVEKYREYT